MSDLISNGFMKIKDADGNLKEFHPYMDIDCIYNPVTKESGSTIISSINKAIIEAPDKANRLFTMNGKCSDSDFEGYANETMVINYTTADPNEFKVTVDTRKVSESNTISAIPFNLYYHDSDLVMNVDWGDGTSTRLTPGSYSYNYNTTPSLHTYPSPGIYEITINCNKWDNLYILSNYANSQLSSSSTRFKALYYTTKTWISIDTIFPGLKGTNYYSSSSSSLSSSTNSFYDLFYYYSNLESIPSRLFYNVPSNSFQYTFGYCTSLKNIPANLFESPSSASSRSISFYYCFAYCTSLQNISFNMFTGCKIPYNIQYCFYSCNLSKPASIRFPGTSVDNYYSTSIYTPSNTSTAQTMTFYVPIGSSAYTYLKDAETSYFKVVGE